MPRLSTLFTPALAELAEQVRFANRDALLKQAARAEELAAQIEPGVTYPEDWLVFRVTGFSPDLQAPRLIPGHEILRDLSSLVERLTVAAELGEHDPEAAGLGVPELCARWGVSRRTIERFRREGLVARRVAADGAPGRARIVFRAGVVERFEASRGLGRSRRGTARLTAADRRDAVAWATRFRARTGCTLNQCAVRLARRSGRSLPTMRRVLEASDRSASEPVFGDPPPMRTRERAIVWRALRWGITPSTIAERFACSPGAVHRAAMVHRLGLLRTLDLDGPVGPLFGSPAGEACLEPASVARPAESPWPVSTQEFVVAAESAMPLGAALERELATALHFLRWRARQAIESINPNQPGAEILDRAETDLRWSRRVLHRLVTGAFPLLLRTAKERSGAASAGSRRGAAQLESLVLAGLPAVIEGTLRFDPFGRGRAAAPVSLALARVFADQEVQNTPAAADASGSWPAWHTVCTSNGTEIFPWWLFPPGRLLRAARSMEGDAGQPILAHFGESGAAPLTLEELHRVKGITPPAFAALYRSVMRSAAPGPQQPSSRRQGPVSPPPRRR